MVYLIGAANVTFDPKGVLCKRVTASTIHRRM